MYMDCTTSKQTKREITIGLKIRYINTTVFIVINSVCTATVLYVTFRHPVDFKSCSVCVVLMALSVSDRTARVSVPHRSISSNSC
jgi:hypothetical protein